jgi:hypothetical protein
MRGEMSFANDLAKVIRNPSLIRKAPRVLLLRFAQSIVSRRLRSEISKRDTSDLRRDHYGTCLIEYQFTWDIFRIQETNLINFVKTFATDDYEAAAEIGATSDIFLKHIKAKCKIGVNVLDACVEQLNRQGITGLKTYGEKMPFEDSEVGLVICFETLEHVQNPILFLTELSRITKGRLLLSIPWVSKTNIRARWHGMDNPDGKEDAEFHVFEFGEDDFRKILSHTDFKIVKYQKLINYEANYDPLTNRAIHKYLYPSYFPAIQAYVLEHKP